MDQIFYGILSSESRSPNIHVAPVYDIEDAATVSNKRISSFHHVLRGFTFVKFKKPRLSITQLY